jgi:hypothetical protein
MISLLLRLRVGELDTLEFLADDDPETFVGRETGDLSGLQLLHARTLAERGLAKLEAGWDGVYWYRLTVAGQGIVALLRSGAYPAFRSSLPAPPVGCFKSSDVVAPPDRVALCETLTIR